MRVKSIVLRNFMTYREARLEPSSGVSLVSGLNGSGKSGVWVEGLTWILYGETVRGVTPLTGKPCEGMLVAGVGGHTYTVARGRTAKESKLLFARDGVDQTSQTVTQTQASICQVFGSFERHVSSRVFSSEHVARFAAATDKGRKELLEQAIPGLTSFDKALTLIRNDLRAAEKTQLTCQTLEARTQGRLEAATERLASLGLVEATVDYQAELATLGQALKQARQAEQVLVSALEANQAARGQENSKKSAALAVADSIEQQVVTYREKAQELPQEGNCPTCLQTLSASARLEAVSHFDSLAAQKAGKAETHIEAASICNQALADLVAQQATLTDQRLKARQAVVTLENQAGTIEKAMIAADRHKRELTQAEASLAEARQTHQAALQSTIAIKARVTHLEGIERVLGLRGARVLLFSRALVKVQQSANVTLSELGSKIRVKISGRTTQASGKEIDAVSVKLQGAGGGEYRGASRGQRNLVDLAILLAMADLQGAADGFVAFDEIVDALDPQVTEAVAEYLRKLSTTRQVVVITPTDNLHTLFPGAIRYQVTMTDEVSYVSQA